MRAKQKANRSKKSLFLAISTSIFLLLSLQCFAATPTSTGKVHGLRVDGEFGIIIDKGYTFSMKNGLLLTAYLDLTKEDYTFSRANGLRVEANYESLGLTDSSISASNGLIARGTVEILDESGTTLSSANGISVDANIYLPVESLNESIVESTGLKISYEISVPPANLEVSSVNTEIHGLKIFAILDRSNDVLGTLTLTNGLLITALVDMINYTVVEINYSTYSENYGLKVDAGIIVGNTPFLPSTSTSNGLLVNADFLSDTDPFGPSILISNGLMIDGIVGDTISFCEAFNLDEILGISCAGCVCGNGILESGEQCDDGIANSNSAQCLLNCSLNRCGDSHIWLGTEQCDDNNTLSGDGCNASCQSECNLTSASWTYPDGIIIPADSFVQNNTLVNMSVIGTNCDGIGINYTIWQRERGWLLIFMLDVLTYHGIDPNWTTVWRNNNPLPIFEEDPIYYLNATAETGSQIKSYSIKVNKSSFFDYCGNSILSPGETCDDGKHCQNHLPCSSDADCTGIGDGTCVPRSGDGCSEMCQIEYCGDGILSFNESCEYISGTTYIWNHNETDNDAFCPGRCDTDCECFPDCCGDSITQSWEDCDDGKECDNSTSCYSDYDCTSGEFCLPRSGDGCTDICENEVIVAELVTNGDFIIDPLGPHTCNNWTGDWSCDAINAITRPSHVWSESLEQSVLTKLGNYRLEFDLKSWTEIILPAGAGLCTLDITIGGKVIDSISSPLPPMPHHSSYDFTPDNLNNLRFFSWCQVNPTIPGAIASAEIIMDNVSVKEIP